MSSLTDVAEAAAATNGAHEFCVFQLMMTGRWCFCEGEHPCHIQVDEALTWIRKAATSVLLPLRHCVLALLGLYTMPAS